MSFCKRREWDTLIPEGPYVAPVSWEQELAAILKEADTDHILNM